MRLFVSMKVFIPEGVFSFAMIVLILLRLALPNARMSVFPGGVGNRVVKLPAEGRSCPAEMRGS